MRANVVMGELGVYAPALTVHNTARFTAPVRLEHNSVFGDSGADVARFNARSDFVGDVSLGDGRSRHKPCPPCSNPGFSSSWLEWWRDPLHFPSQFQSG